MSIKISGDLIRDLLKNKHEEFNLISVTIVKENSCYIDKDIIFLRKSDDKYFKFKIGFYISGSIVDYSIYAKPVIKRTVYVYE